MTKITFQEYMRPHIIRSQIYFEWEWQELIDMLMVLPYGIPVEDKPRNLYNLKVGGRYATS